IGTLETQYKIASGFSAFNIKLSPQHLFTCGGGWCDFGWFPENAAQWLQSHGVPDESCMPYISGATGQDVACSAGCSDAPRRSLKISSFATPTRNAKDLDSLRTALQKGPLVTTLGVYEDFMAYSSGVYKHVTGKRLGGHAVSIVGYDDTTNSFIIRNSWGEGWGENGFAHVAYDDISGIGEETWGYDMPSMNGAVTVEGPIDYTYTTGSLQLKAFSTYSGTDSLSVSFFGADGKAAWTGSCAGNSCNQAIDVSSSADGRYEIQALAMDKAGHALGNSTRQFFYVSNHQPTLALSFTGANGTDLSKPLKARMEVAITESSSTVPMSSVEFHYRGADGKDVQRTASVVVNGMTMGWRTNLVTNGSYEIWMVGHVKTNSMETTITTSHKAVTVAN
ncbi:MAG: C1 family peptidase, partial [Bdellovibrionales bacterium]